MKESKIEEYLRDSVKGLGGRAYKFVSPGNAGVPDRMVLLPGGKIAFVELKAPGKTSTALQANQQRRLRAFGFPVYPDIDDLKKVDELIKEVLGL